VLKGTTVEVRDLFYNTPARKKFLKSIPTETSHVIDAVMQKALPFPHISFFLRHNNSEIISATSAKSLEERFRQLYSEELFNEFVETRNEGSGIRLYGFVSSAEFARSAKNHQLIFINRRPVKNPTVSHAVYSVYRDLLPKDRHPAFFLFLDIDPEKVDVNVHPTKREVRFESPDEVHRMVEFSVRYALRLHSRNTDRYVQSSGSVEIKPEHETCHGQMVRETLESALRAESRHSLPDVQSDFFTEGIVPLTGRYFYVGGSFLAGSVNDGLMVIDLRVKVLK